MLFLDWVIDYYPYLFPSYREPNVSLDGLLHFLMRRIEGLDYKALMYMPIRKRDLFFQEEYKAYEKENKKSEN